MRSTRPAALALVLASLAVVPTARSEDWKREQKDVHVPMRDGAWLAADLYFPTKPGKYPVVLIQTPYNKSRLGAPISGQEPARPDKMRGAESDTLGLLDRESYVYAVVDWRGFYGSKEAQASVKRGEWSRGHDGYDCVEWLAAREWSTGKIGTWGPSALGKVQLETAVEHPPHLVCAVPVIAAMGQKHEHYYENGVLLEAHVSRLRQLGFPIPAAITDNANPDALAWRVAEKRTYRPSEIDVPCLFITGWWDNFPDAVVKTFEDVVAKGGEKARKHSKLLVGPWDHVSVGLASQGDRSFEKAARASSEAAKAFFDVWLRGASSAEWEKTPRVRFWTINEDAWTGCESWSALERDTTTLHLHASGEIAAAAPAKASTEQPLERRFTTDPKSPCPTLGGRNLPPLGHGPKDQGSLEKRADVLVYSTGKLAAPLHLDGSATLELTFASDRPDCDLVALLCDVDAKGTSTLVQETAQRAKWRDPSKGAQPLAKGERVRLEVRFQATSVTFPAGHELRVVLAGAGSPRYERNAHTGADHFDEASAVPVQVTVSHDAERPFLLSLPARRRNANR